jgi:hypothetical protein
MKYLISLLVLLSFNTFASSVDCYRKAIQLKDIDQEDKTKQSFAYNLCKGSDDSFPVSCYEEFLTLPDYILPTAAAKHFAALTICRGAMKGKISPMSCFMEAIVLPLDLTLNHKTPIEFAINFCKARHQYL